MSTLNDNDLMLIERDGVQYKVESQYVNVGPDGTITSPVEVLTPVDGDGLIVGTQDAVISSAITAVDGNTITFASDVSSSLKAPISMVDANGNPIAPTTSNITTTTAIPGGSVATNYTFSYPGSTSVGSHYLINSAANMHPGNSMPTGDRMLWIKSNNNSNNAISDSAVLNGLVLFTDADISAQNFSGGVEFGAGYTRLPYDVESLGTEYDHSDVYATEIGVSPGLLDIVTWNGSGTNDTNRRIPHSLGTVPGMILVKLVNGSQDWYVYHSAKGVDSYQAINNSTNWTSGFNAWGSAPTATDFGINEDNLNTKDVNSEYVAYVFAEDTAGKVKCGTYSGNSGDNFINVGFQPNFVLIRNKDESGYPWVAANTFSMVNQRLWRPGDATHTDGSNSEYINNNSTSIHLKGPDDKYNKTGKQYVYLAVAGNIVNPDTTQLTFQDDTNLDQLTSGMTVTSDGPAPSIDLFSTQLYTGTGNSQKVNTGVDLSSSGGLFWLKGRDTDGDHWLYDSERGSGSHLRIEGGVSATNHGVSYNVDFHDDGVQVGSNGSINNSGKLYVGWSFAEKPGFFDVVSYTGDGDINKTVPHSLGSVPGMIIIKNISGSGTNWYTWHKDIGGTGKALALNNYEAVDNNYNLFSTLPTDTVFSPGDNSHTNQYGQSFVAYVFADNPSNGVKCGTFSNNTGSWGPPAPSDAVVDCGFAPQFIIAKTLDSLGGWYMMDSERGWSTSGDHQVAYRNASVQAQERNAEVTEGNFNFNATSTGFEVTYSKPGTWIFLAIGSPTGVGSPPTAELTADADPSTNTAIVNASSWPAGDSVTGPATTATASSFITGSYSSAGFSATTYTGTGSTMSISTGIDLTTKGLMWFKGRGGSGFSDTSHFHLLFDSERNNYGSYLQTSQTDAQGDFASYGWAPQPAADGTISNLRANLIHSNVDWVVWAFRALPGFFDIQTWTGNNVAGRTIPHNLGTAPGMILAKRLNDSDNWVVYHKGLGATHPMVLNETYAAEPITNRWNDTEPTSTEFTVGTWPTNDDGIEYVAYLFADNPSQGIKCGSYLGNATNGAAPAVPNQIECGFRPKWVLIKNAGNSTDWLIFDDQRDDRWLKANESDSEGYGNPAPVIFNDTGFSLPTGYHYVNQDNTEHIFVAISADAGESGTLASNQIKMDGVTGTFQTGTNVKGSDYIYEITSQSSAITAVNGNTLTFADQDGLIQMTAPVSTDTGTATGFTYGSYTVPTFATSLYSHTGVPQTITNGIDLAGEGGLVWTKWRSGGAYSTESHCLIDTERSSGSSTDQYGTLTPYLRSDQINGQTNAHYINFNSDGYEINTNSSLINHDSGGEYVSWTFRKASGFFDIATYTGNGGAQTISHSLGTDPGMIIIKNIDSSYHWTVWHRSLSTGEFLRLNTSESTKSSYQNSHVSSASSTNFTLGSDAEVNKNTHAYVAYVFADNLSNGIKCGTYTGNGVAQTIDVGFEPQWILIKSIDSEYREWIIVDNVRGSGSGNTGKMLQPSTNREELGTNIDFVSNGFELFDMSSEVNWPDHDYIYVAISADAGESADLETNQASLQGVTGTFSVGQTVTGAAQVADHPLTSEIEFKSVNGASGTGEFNGTDCTLNARVWTLETASDINGPWTVVDTYVDTDANASQDGATPWTTGTPTLQPNTIYRVKVQYQTADSAPVESTYHTFKTGAS